MKFDCLFNIAHFQRIWIIVLIDISNSTLEDNFQKVFFSALLPIFLRNWQTIVFDARQKKKFAKLQITTLHLSWLRISRIKFRTSVMWMQKVRNRNSQTTFLRELSRVEEELSAKLID